MDAFNDLQSAMDVVFGLKKPDGRAKHFKTLPDLYGYYTGDESAMGVFNPRGLPEELRASMAITSSSFPKALANTLNRFLSAGYSKINYFENALISQKGPASHLHQGRFVELGCWPDLPDIDPEAEDYPEMEELTEAENAFDLLQKGTAIPISRMVVINNEVGLIKKLMDRSGLVARKTHARYVWSFFVDNSNCNDGTSWFTEAHGNLGSDSFSISAVTAVITALASMTEPGPSTDKIGLDLSNFKWHLAVPISMWDDAAKLNQSKSYYTSNDLTAKEPNPWYRLFGANNERIATPPFLTSDTDWGVIRNPEEVPIVEMQYLNGQEEPEIYFEQSPLSDKAISGDWFGLKIRHEYAGAVSDYRGAYKSTP
ncbi:MAG: hypothetical protein JRI95_13860 [Deltaproteobacteria bacterium]|nr:hypothetical protein [Deltaproteobacteria bacterium]